MRKAKEVLRETDSNKEYKSAVSELLKHCPLCMPNRGCNRNRDYENGWKSKRDNQWREKK